MTDDELRAILDRHSLWEAHVSQHPTGAQNPAHHDRGALLAEVVRLQDEADDWKSEALEFNDRRVAAERLLRAAERVIAAARLVSAVYPCVGPPYNRLQEALCAYDSERGR